MMVLTLVAFKSSITDLPKVSYLTMLDRIFLFDLSALCLSVAEICFAYWAAQCHTPGLPHRLLPATAKTALDEQLGSGLACAWALGRLFVVAFVSASDDSSRLLTRQRVLQLGLVVGAGAAGNLLQRVYDRSTSSVMV